MQSALYTETITVTVTAKAPYYVKPDRTIQAPVEASFDRVNPISEGTYMPATLTSAVISPELKPYLTVTS